MEGEENRMEKLILAFSLICLLLSVLFVVSARKRLVEYTRQMGECLDAMLAGSPDLVFQEEKDTLMGKLQSKLHRLYEILNRKSQENKIQRQQLETIVADFSHQVKTPIANIRMYHSLLQKKNLDEEKREQFLDAAQRQTDKLEFLMKSMIKMSRLETGIVEVQPKENSIRALLEQAVCDIALKAEKKQIEIEMHCEEDLKAVFDKKWTLEAVFNILDNAVKYSPKGSRIEVEGISYEMYFCIAVKDQGIGIREEERAQIFSRFYRSDLVQQEEGIGIGLYLAREIVQREGGYIKVESKEGNGSIFKIFLQKE